MQKDMQSQANGTSLRLNKTVKQRIINRKIQNKKTRRPKMNNKKIIKTITSPIAGREKLARYNQISQSSYRRAILAPEYVRDAKIPALFPLPTNSMHMKSSVKFQTNTLGNAALLINPWLLWDSTNTASWILINNDPALDLATNVGLTTNFTAYSMASRCTANTVSAYRLVSAALHIYPEMSINTAQGFIAGGIVTRAVQPSSYTVGSTGNAPFGGSAAVASIIDQALYYQKAQIGGQSGIRATYLPFDPTFEAFIGINYGRSSMFTRCDDFYWNYYITGTQAGANMIAEIYYNFELEPLQESVLQLFTTIHSTNEKAESTLDFVSRNPELITQSSPNLLETAREVDESILSNKKPSFLKRTIDWVSDNSGNLLNILSTFGKMAL